MTKLKQTIVDMFKKSFIDSRKAAAERYLAESGNLVELERRQRELTFKGF
jgi:hypothetical protein